MEEYMYNNPEVRKDDEGPQIDWMEILAKLLRRWKQIFVICFVFGVLGILSSARARPSLRICWTSPWSPSFLKNRRRTAWNRR